MDKEITKKFKKTLKTDAVFAQIIEYATIITVNAVEGLRTTNKKRQEIFMKTIMEFTERIDNLYSSNWH